jgi:hypothetical protein
MKARSLDIKPIKPDGVSQPRFFKRMEQLLSLGNEFILIESNFDMDKRPRLIAPPNTPTEKRR